MKEHYIVVKKIWHGQISLRSYQVEQAIMQNRTLKVLYKRDLMTLSPEQLKRGKRNGKQHHSQFNNQIYHLIDYRWKPDKENKCQQQELFQTI